MRKFMMVAAAAAIALVGLSANMCGEQKPAEPTPPETQPSQPETPPPPPAQ
jgi:hypothetical protein